MCHIIVLLFLLLLFDVLSPQVHISHYFGQVVYPNILKYQFVPLLIKGIPLVK